MTAVCGLGISIRLLVRIGISLIFSVRATTVEPPASAVLMMSFLDMQELSLTFVLAVLYLTIHWKQFNVDIGEMTVLLLSLNTTSSGSTTTVKCSLSCCFHVSDSVAHGLNITYTTVSTRGLKLAIFLPLRCLATHIISIFQYQSKTSSRAWDLII